MAEVAWLSGREARRGVDGARNRVMFEGGFWVDCERESTEKGRERALGTGFGSRGKKADFRFPKMREIGVVLTLAVGRGWRKMGRYGSLVGRRILHRL